MYALASATHKHWIVFPEYGYTPAEYPADQHYASESRNEGEFIREFWKQLPADAAAKRICIDTTGFIRPYLLFLVLWLKTVGVREVDFIYSEPVQYEKGEETRFSDEVVVEVRSVVGFEGSHVTDTSRDYLIIGSGYDDKLIAEVAEKKDQAHKIQIFGLPSLRADMYQENVLRAHKAEAAVGAEPMDESSSFFAPANDPFATASVLQAIVAHLKQRQMTNLYLSPLATKPQVLGFALYYLWEGVTSPCSIIFPFSQSYSKETTVGLARVWKYTAVLPAT